MKATTLTSQITALPPTILMVRVIMSLVGGIRPIPASGVVMVTISQLAPMVTFRYGEMVNIPVPMLMVVDISLRTAPGDRLMLTATCQFGIMMVAPQTGTLMAVVNGVTQTAPPVAGILMAVVNGVGLTALQVHSVLTAAAP